MKKHFMLTLILVFSLSILVAEEIYVGQGESIQAALNNADPTDIIILTGTHYDIQQTLIVPEDNLTLKSNNTNPEDCIIDGADMVRILDVNNVSGFLLENVCIQNGYTNTYPSAAGITYYHSWENEINNCIIRDCNGIYSLGVGGIKCITSSLTISNSTAENNYGGGYGFIDFRSLESGYQEHLIINNTIISNNQGTYGGGIYGYLTETAQLSINNCLLYDNSGGAIDWAYNGYSTVFADIKNSTICNNIGSYYGIDINSNSVYELNLNILNSIVWGNSGTQIPISNHTTVSYTDVQSGYTGTGNIDEDPMFNEDYTLFYESEVNKSPCIDTGDPNAGYDIDGSLPDMGCYPYLHNYDTKVFTKGVHWISFPILTQDEIYVPGPTNPSIPPIDNQLYQQAYYENGDVGLLQDESGNTINSFESILGNRYGTAMSIIPNGPNWVDWDVDFKNMLFRHEGYKIEIGSVAIPTTLIVGDGVDDERLSINYEIAGSMVTDEYHWIGYWIPRTQNIKAAFGDGTQNDFWQHVVKVKSEDWFYSPAIIQRGEEPDPNYPTVLSAENLNLEYGKAYLVLFNEQIEDFRWTDSSITVEAEKKSEPESFTYTEKADYEAIDVFNIPPNVIEIGVFEDEVCVGAVVVEDTCAQILAYSDYANRDPVPFTFEVVTGRGFSAPIKDYQVLDWETGEFESRSIFSGRQEYSVIRFGDDDEPEDNTLSTPQLHGNYPNPFNPTTTISFSLPEEQEIDLTIYNIKGQKVKRLIDGQLTAGQHSMIWDGKDTNGKSVSTGIYFYKLKTSKKEISRKMLLLK